MTERIIIVRSNCGGDDVLADAYAAWDFQSQKWKLSNIFDKGAYCKTCESETRLIETTPEDAT